MLDQLLTKLSILQHKEADGFYVKGMFPSERYHPYFKHRRPDNNVFFTASILYILRQLRDSLGTVYQQRIDEILIKADKVDEPYCVDGICNFWQKKPHAHFPSSNWLHKFSHFKLPDDIDTSAMVAMGLNADRQTASYIAEKAPLHANDVNSKVKNTLKSLEGLSAYSTWFGRHMPIEFDVCVLTNFLVFKHVYDLPKNKHDADTLELINRVVQGRYYLTKPFRVAPEYPDPCIILYHLARFCAISGYKGLKTILTEDALRLHEKASGMYKVLLEIALVKLGESLSQPMNIAEYPDHKVEFQWFTAGFLSVYSHKLLKSLAPHPVFHMKFNCEAFNLALLLEHYCLCYMKEK